MNVWTIRECDDVKTLAVRFESNLTTEPHVAGTFQGSNLDAIKWILTQGDIDVGGHFIVTRNYADKVTGVHLISRRGAAA